MNDLSQAVD